MHEYDIRFLASEIEPRLADECFFHVIPVPYEDSVSYGAGTARGPDAILRASEQLELFDGTGCPGEKGIFTWPPVDCSGTAEDVMARVELGVAMTLEYGGTPVVLGGEHSLSYGALKALKEKHGTFGIVQFDAHADLRDVYEGSKWSHAAVMRRAVADLGLPLVQLGNRSYCREEKEARRAYNVTAWDASYLCRRGIPSDLMPAGFPGKVYISFDVDGLDPSIIPETGTPVPGGLGWYLALDLAARAVKGRKFLGFDVVELAPRPDRHASDFAAASLVYALMGLF